ncbi:Thymocyte nuclear protein 1 [Verticillium dahliae VDG2]|nr:Thymocyte nuclear protein 1 [Verticillium dahliae VDG2]
MATAVSGEGLVIPLIDFSGFLHGDAAERQATARAILHGFQTAGFIYLKNHPIDEATLARAFAASAAFFAQADEAKLALGWTTPEANRGYSAPGREKPPGGGADGDVYPPRYSIAYFCNPNYKDYIEALPGTYASEAEKKYEGINSGEYLVQRLTATY